MRNRDGQSEHVLAAFTLLELILVMVILAIASALIVPSLRGFAISRASDSAATQIVTLAQYARTQAISQGKTYRLNFDVEKGEVWLTMLEVGSGNYIPPPNDFGNRYPLPSGMKMTVDLIPQPNTVLMVPLTVVQNTVQPVVPYGQLVAPQTNQIIQNAHADGTYMEFQSGGRTDPVFVTLIDKLGKEIDLGCQSATETLHVLTATETK